MKIHYFVDRERCSLAFPHPWCRLEECCDSVESRKVNSRKSAPCRPAPLVTMVDWVPGSNHAMKNRKMIYNPAIPENSLRRGQFGTVFKGRFPHPEPGANRGDIVLFHKLIELRGVVVVLCNEERQIGPVKRSAARM